MGLRDLRAELSQLDVIDQGPLLQQLSHDQFSFSPSLVPRLQPCCAVGGDAWGKRFATSWHSTFTASLATRLLCTLGNTVHTADGMPLVRVRYTLRRVNFFFKTFFSIFK